MNSHFYVRLWKVIPGLATWLTLGLLVMLSFTQPHIAVSIVLIYTIYWLIKVVIMTSYLAAGFVRYRREIKIEWAKKLEQEFPGIWREVFHLVIVPTYKEDISILRRTLEAINRSHYPNDRLIVVLAFEAREKKMAPQYATALKREYDHTFYHFLTTFHPENIAGEVKGKGPNITWAARKIKEWIDQKGINYQKIIVTTLDADNRVDPQYFANLTYLFLRDPDPYHKSFQPLPMFFNNIWKVPLPVKMTALGSSFWQIIQAMRPHYARNFAAHAQSFAALVKTDFWSVHTIVEDGHQYWRSFFAFNGNHYVVPMFVPVYMDAVQGENLYDTFREQYLQRRRWYWGVSDIPYVFSQARNNSRIDTWYKWLQFARLFEAHYSLATQSFILLLGWLPLIVEAEFGNTVLGYNFPTVYKSFLLAAWIGMIVSMFVATRLTPPRPGSKIGYIITVVKEWLLAPLVLPISSIFFSAIPAIDSQTRLMLNKPFTVFNVTKKAAVDSGIVRISEN